MSKFKFNLCLCVFIASIIAFFAILVIFDGTYLCCACGFPATVAVFSGEKVIWDRRCEWLRENIIRLMEDK